MATTIEYLEELPVVVAVDPTPEWHVMWVIVILFFIYLFKYLCFSGNKPPTVVNIKHAND